MYGMKILVFYTIFIKHIASLYIARVKIVYMKGQNINVNNKEREDVFWFF